MMKAGKPALQAAKASCSSVEFSLAYPNASLKLSSCPLSNRTKSKLNRFKMTTSILKQSGSSSSLRPPESSNGLPNGLVVSDESGCETSSPCGDHSKDISDFGLYQKHHWSSKEAASGSGEILREMYSLSEEAGESESSGAEEQSKEVTARANVEKELPGNKLTEESPENTKETNISHSLGEFRENQTTEEDKDSPCAASDVDTTPAGSHRDEDDVKTHNQK